MNKRFKLLIPSFAFCLSIIALNCNNTNDSQTTSAQKFHLVSTKNDFEAAKDFFSGLKESGIDTIIFYKRTCINCCDFFNFFWTSDGQKNIGEVFYDIKDSKTHTIVLPIKNDSIFNIVGNNFSELKSFPILQNEHKLNDSSTYVTFIDHYCYSEISIFLGQDSIVSTSISDHDFDEFADFMHLPGDSEKTRLLNDNYNHNAQSKWNLLITAIEGEIANRLETPQRELNILRTREKSE